jgi:beta-glucosidase
MSNVQAAIKRNGIVVLLILLAALAVLLAGVRSGAPDAANADSSVLPYQDASRPVDQRVADLLSRMTLPEKVGQMGQINVQVLQGSPDTPWDRGPLNPALLADVLDKNQIGSILSGGGAWPPVGDDGKAWADEINTIQQFPLDHSRLRIPIIYGADASTATTTSSTRRWSPTRSASAPPSTRGWHSSSVARRPAPSAPPA